MELDDELVLFLGEVATLEIGAQVVYPAEAAALAATKQAGGLGERAPASLAMGTDVGDQTVIFLLGPCSLVGVSFLAAWRPSHGLYYG